MVESPAGAGSHSWGGLPQLGRAPTKSRTNMSWITHIPYDQSSGDLRDLYWFVDGIGWARLRTERRGRVIRDQVLIAFEPGATN